jgi:hypothetical protein
VVIGSDGSAPILLVFNDLAATSETATGVPETGSALGLLGVSATALAGLAMVRRLGLA